MHRVAAAFRERATFREAEVFSLRTSRLSSQNG
jgi:hypothetical protein